MPDSLDLWFSRRLAGVGDESAAIADALQALDNADVLGRVVVHRYICPKCGPVALVVKLGGRVLARTRDYKHSRGRNEATTAPAAREARTLDGDRHWPGHVFDVDDMARWGDALRLPLKCAHHDRTVTAAEVLALVADVRPGHPGRPTIL